MPTTVTSDGAPGLIKAIEAVFSSSVRIRCWFHRLANIRAKIPDEAAPEVLAYLYAVRDAPTLDAARVAADRFTNRFAAEFPAAVACFEDDRDALARHPPSPGATPRPGPHDQPGGTILRRGTSTHQGHTPALDRTLDDELAFATMICAADHWCRVSISDLERHQLHLLRVELGLDPPPTQEQRKSRTERNAA